MASAGEDVEEMKLRHIADENVKCKTIENSLAGSYKIKHTL